MSTAPLKGSGHSRLFLLFTVAGKHGSAKQFYATLGHMRVHISDDPAREAAERAVVFLRSTLQRQGSVRILVATGNSQIRFLDLMVRASLDWTHVELFHLDEYIGIGCEHRASFTRYIREKVLVPTGICHYHLLDGMQDPREVIERVGSELSKAPIDLAFAGIGENGHLAFNDPPANFEIEDPYTVVELDEACRRQQVNEGWFGKLDDVPMQAISISIHQLMQSREIISVVPDLRKAHAVASCLEGEISPEFPASILRRHPNASLYLDGLSSAKLKASSVAKLGM